MKPRLLDLFCGAGGAAVGYHRAGFGTGTTALVARALGRTRISLDLSADYSRLARWRIFQSGHAAKTRERTNRDRQGNSPVTYLKGPADADHYRVKVGRYGDRWYHDPLPSCPIAETTDQSWPAVSIIKKASGSDWTYVGLKRVAQALEQRPHDIDGLTYEERYERFKAYNRTGLNAAGARGTGVHAFAEQLLLGQKPNRQAVMNKDAEKYLPALEQWFDENQPELVAKEIVCICRTPGWGGTADTFVKIDGKLYILDWKSRGDDSEHGCYPEEAAQLAAYACADYAIAESGRITIPKVDGGLIVSIRTDGCRTYPVDIDKAKVHWLALHDWWTARRNERDAIGKPWAPTRKETTSTSGPSTSPERSNGTSPSAVHSWDEMTFDEQPKPSASSPAARTLGGVLPVAKVGIEEGPEAPQNDLNKLKTRWKVVAPWVDSIVADASAHGAPIGITQNPSQRRYLIGLALVRFAELCSYTDEDLEATDGGEGLTSVDDMLRTALHIVLGNEVQPAVSLGLAVGSLTIAEAETLNDIARAIHKGGVFVYGSAGAPRVVAA
jgi:hypothetical protein